MNVGKWRQRFFSVSSHPQSHNNFSYRHLPIWLTVLFAWPAMSQTITVQDMGDAGVRLVQHSDPLFMSAISSDRSPLSAAPLPSAVLLPYAVVISNDTDQEIFAYSVRWKCTSPEGESVIQESTIYNLATLRGLAPHSRKLVTGLATTQDAKEISRFAAFYQNQAKIEISLEAVVFADGRTLGSDTGFHIPRIKAWVDAERDLVREIQTTAANELEFMLKKERDDALAELSTPDVRKAGLAMAANNSPAYHQAYKFAKGDFAAQMLVSIQQKGINQAVDSVRQMSARRIWPDIKDHSSGEK